MSGFIHVHLYLLSMHQFIEISICAFEEEKKSNTNTQKFLFKKIGAWRVDMKVHKQQTSFMA